jgi:hypothetical protein
LFVGPEVGYSYLGVSDAHAFNATIGVGYGIALAAIAYQPRFFVGDGLIGTLQGLTLHFFGPSLEFAYQYLAADRVDHDLTLMLGLNFGLLAYFFGYRG